MDTKNRTFERLFRSVSLVERAKEQLEDLIVAGSLLPGHKLPSERKLGEMLGVSRTVVRETIRTLAANGLIEVTSGSGTHVRELGPAIIRDSVSLLLRANRLAPGQIFEVRSVLETTVAGLAAERASAEDVEALTEEISALQREELPVVEYAKHDFSFHVRLAESTHNPLFLALINSLSTVMIRSMYQMYSSGQHEYTYQHVTTAEHLLVIDQIKKHNVDGAREAMANHMAQSLIRLRRAQPLIAPGQTSSV